MTLPDSYRRVEVMGGWAVVNNEVAEWIEHAVTIAGTVERFAFNQTDRHILHGRGQLVVTSVPGGVPVVIRRLRHGGMLAPFTRDRFLRAAVPRSVNELLVSHRLRSLAVATPRVLAALVYPGPL